MILIESIFGSHEACNGRTLLEDMLLWRVCLVMLVVPMLLLRCDAISADQRFRPTSYPARQSVAYTWPLRNVLGIRGGSLKAASLSSESPLLLPKTRDDKRVKLWKTCILAVLIWITTGTLFYAKVNKWPLPTAFFYAVDAGMSIGFCTDIREETIKSRAFTVFFILAGASVVGGALALFVTDTLEGISNAVTHEFRTILEQDAFRKHDDDADGKLTYYETKALLLDSGYHLSDFDLQRLVNNLDRNGDGLVSEKEFYGAFRKAEFILQGLDPFVNKWSSRIKTVFEDGIYFMYLVFFAWLLLGISWGMINQKWDIVTSAHFAVSALATGGLTAPPTNEQGILPPGVAIFVGLYALLGIPIFYLALGHSAKLLVQSHLVEIERGIIATPLEPSEFYLAKSLCSRDELIHLSDFIVLHFLRRGLTNLETVNFLKRQFDEMDQDKDGLLNYTEATQRK